MKKKIFATLLVFIAAIILASSFSVTYATMNEIRNFVSGAENTIEGAAGGAANMVRSGTNTISGTMNNFMNSNEMDGRNSVSGAMTMNNNTTVTGNYTATRTAVTADNVTFAGISARVWTIIIIAVALIGIGVLVWSYMTQKTHRSSNYYDE